MDNFLNPSPDGLNNSNISSSPFSDEAFRVNSNINFEDNIFSKNPETKSEEPIEVENSIKKRINDYDANILNKYAPIEEPDFKNKLMEFFKNKPTLEKIKNLKFEDFEDLFYIIFPNIYKSKMVKESLKRLVALNKVANELITKKIPYGENQEHYSDLISSLAMATNIQADLKKRIS